jgi:solute carrier family 45 protein 1/2/4
MDHIRIVFGVAILLHLVCIFLTVSSFPEVPLDEITGSAQRHQAGSKTISDGKYHKFTNEEECDEIDDGIVQGSYQLERNDINTENNQETGEIPNNLHHGTNQQEAETRHVMDYGTNRQQDGWNQNKDNIGNGYESFGNDLEGQGHGEGQGQGQTDQNDIPQDISLKTYLLSILHLPKSIFWLCLTNLFSWMALLCYSLYFTDYVGQAVYGGDPTEPEGSPSHDAYASGVRLGSLAMSLYSLSCSIYSLVIEKLVKRFGKHFQ